MLKLDKSRPKLHLPGHGAEVASEIESGPHPTDTPPTGPSKEDLGQGDAAPPIPEFWRKGSLLNVRNTGAHYTVTLYPEEFDYKRPERALIFSNPAELQAFVSAWYSRESFDPRAF